jgi:5-methyltetrahydrofolate--homocysteine methyltransferase
MNQVIEEIYEGVITGQKSVVLEKVSTALESGHDPAIILKQGMVAAMAEVGRKFEAGEFFVPEMLIAARAMQVGLTLIKPHLQEHGVKSEGRVIIGTVRGDLHDIGKNLVAMMFEGAGFEIHDLGTDVSPEKFVEAAKIGLRDNEPLLIAMSALLTTTMVNMRATIDALHDSGMRDNLKVIIGGAPVTEDYANQIGADGYAEDAGKAVSIVKSLFQF